MNQTHVQLRGQRDRNFPSRLQLVLNPVLNKLQKPEKKSVSVRRRGAVGGCKSLSQLTWDEGSLHRGQMANHRAFYYTTSKILTG